MMPISPSVIHEVVLAGVQRSINRAEQLVIRQCHHIEKMEQQGWAEDLPIRVLENLIISLTLLNECRVIIQQEMTQTH